MTEVPKRQAWRYIWVDMATLARIRAPLAGKYEAIGGKNQN